MILPNLFIPGAGKSATSSLHELLNQHPQIFMSLRKEPHFFNKQENFEENYQPKDGPLESYAQLFSDGKDYQYRGESSTGYMLFPHVVERIQHNIADPRFIFILRNPIERAYSHYWWIRGRGHEKRSFREALIADMGKIPDPKNRVKDFGGYYYYFAAGQYATYIKPFWDIFNKDQILIVTTEALKQDARQTLNQCFAFLDLDPFNINLIELNKTVVFENPGLYAFLTWVGSKVLSAKRLKARLSTPQYTRFLSFQKKISDAVSSKLRRKSVYPVISFEDRQWLQSLYSKEVEDLRQMTGLAFEPWQRDFPLLD